MSASGANTRLSPEPAWIKQLEDITAVELDMLLSGAEKPGSLSHEAAETLEARILDRHRLLCDVVEAGEACVDGIIPLAGSKTEHFVLSLAALRAEVERDA